MNPIHKAKRKSHPKAKFQIGFKSSAKKKPQMKKNLYPKKHLVRKLLKSQIGFTI